MKDTAASNAPAILTLGADLSPALAALEKAYSIIQAMYPDTPAATIVIKRDERAWGHTTVAHTWGPSGAETPDRLEIMISGENLARGTVYVAATLLHEAAHARNLAKGILDTDVNGRHNAKFKAAAEEMHLTVTGGSWKGFTNTELEHHGQIAWTVMLDIIHEGLRQSAKAHKPRAIKLSTPEVEGAEGEPEAPEDEAPVAPRKRGDRNLIKAMCECGDSIRASRGVLERCKPTCSECESPFLEVQKL